MRCLTEEVDHEAVAIAVDVGSRVRLELDGDVGGGGVELEAGARSAVLTQHLGREVVPIVEGQQVVLPNVQPGEQQQDKQSMWSRL